MKVKSETRITKLNFKYHNNIINDHDNLIKK